MHLFNSLFQLWYHINLSFKVTTLTDILMTISIKIIMIPHYQIARTRECGTTNVNVIVPLLYC